MNDVQKRLLKKTAAQFRILHGWTIRGVLHTTYSGTVSVHPTKRYAVVYLWHGKPPHDFIFHEVLHIALRQLRRMDRRKPKELHAAEEQLVQDICQFVNDDKPGDKKQP